MNRLRSVAIVASAVLFATWGDNAAFAQRPNPDASSNTRAVRPAAAPARATAPRPAAEPSNRPQEVITPSGSSIDLEISKGVLVRLRQPAGSVFIANPDIADVQVRSPSLIYLFGKKPGQTVLYAVDEQERVVLNSTVSVAHNLTRLRDQFRAVVPNEDVRIATVDNSLVISGSVTSAEQAEEVRRIAVRFAPEPGAIINQLKVTTPNQVNLRVRIAEVRRDVLKVLGFNWDALARFGDFTLGLAVGAPTTLLNNVVAGATTNSFFAGDGKNVNSVIDALNREGLITILAEPNLTAMSGETASFLSGGEFPFAVPQQNGTPAVEFKQFGVSLAFTPTILGGERISMRVRPEVSQTSTVIKVGDSLVPSLSTRRAETTVELGSGQTFAIAGLLQNSTSQSNDRTPGIADIPILGALFRSDQFQRNETEIVIIITPYIVRPVSQKAVVAPTDGYVAPNDSERFFGGQLYRQQSPERSAGVRASGGQTLIGPAGFVLE